VMIAPRQRKAPPPNGMGANDTNRTFTTQQRTQMNHLNALLDQSNVASWITFAGAERAGRIADDDRWTGLESEGASVSAAAKARRDLLSLRPMLLETELRCGDYEAWWPEDDALIYVDPPFEGTEPYPEVAPFDSPRMRRVLTERSRRQAVFVSEDHMTPDWREVLAIPIPSPGLSKDKVSRVWVHRGGLADQLVGDLRL